MIIQVSTKLQSNYCFYCSVSLKESIFDTPITSFSTRGRILTFSFVFCSNKFLHKMIKIKLIIKKQNNSFEVALLLKVKRT